MAASVSKASHTILVVDDDEEVLALAVDVLEIAGYTVLSTPDPRHALRLAATPQNPSDGPQPRRTAPLASHRRRDAAHERAATCGRIRGPSPRGQNSPHVRLPHE